MVLHDLRNYERSGSPRRDLRLSSKGVRESMELVATRIDGPKQSSWPKRHQSFATPFVFSFVTLLLFGGEVGAEECKAGTCVLFTGYGLEIPLRRRVVSAMLPRYGHLLKKEEVQALRAFELHGSKSRIKKQAKEIKRG